MRSRNCLILESLSGCFLLVFNDLPSIRFRRSELRSATRVPLLVAGTVPQKNLVATHLGGI